MNAHSSPIPWNTDALWQEANFSLAHALRQNHAEMAESRQQAHRIKCQLESTFPLMDRLCQQTCPTCRDICCQRAWVWADFKDLLFFHLARIPFPCQQLLCRQGDRCRYGGPDGCRLDRLQRPFVCTWYLCPGQTALFRKEPAKMKRISDSIQQIKRLRQKMEKSFIRAVV